MAYNNIQEVFEAFKNLHVLVVGDVMIDAYVYGTVNRISPEAPVPVVNVSKRESRLGGAANVARNLISLGTKTTICAVIGQDEYGNKLKELCQKADIGIDGLVQSSDRPTTVKFRVISGSQQMLRIDEETTEDLNAQEREQFISQVTALIPSADLIIFEDYDKGLLDEASISSLIEAARTHDVPTAVDPKKKNFSHYKHCTLFKPNLKELFEGLNQPVPAFKKETVDYATQQLQEELNFDYALITLSENGVMVKSSSETHFISAHIRDISDVSGAGDTVISIASLALALKLPLKTIAELANLGGGLVCEHLGVVPINKEDLIQESLKTQLELTN